MKEENFSPLKFNKAVRFHNKEVNYLVYKTSEEFVEVQADSASEALERSNIKSPYKIVHLMPNLDSFLQEQDLKFVKDEDAQDKEIILQQINQIPDKS